MEELAEELDGEKEQLLDRWDGRPDRIAEDVFRVRDMETGNLGPLRLFKPYQPQLLSAYFYSDASIINVYKGRRIGVSFIFGLAITIDALTTPGANYAIVSRTRSQSEERLSDIRELLKHSRFVNGPVGEWLETDNNAELVFPNGAEIHAFSGDPASARGMDSAKTVFVDEMAWLEDQDATMQAFMPFINLGSHRQMLQVSTPRTSNDKFLTTHERGSPAGNNGVVSIQQPSFEKPDQIDIHTSLFEQDVEPVRHDMDVASVEVERAQDPEGFAQEYLCRPISDEYRFFSSDDIFRAQARGAASENEYGELVGTYTGWSPATHARKGGKMIMGVDIGIDRDDTAIAVFEHTDNHRYLRFHTLLDASDLTAVGINSHRVNDPSKVARYVQAVVQNMGIDRVYLDKTGPGKGFQKEVERRIGRRAVGFNFSNKDEIARMMGDFNYALHNDTITLTPDDTISGQLEAIVKEKRHETSKPRFSGKDNAPNGKDDMAMALVLAAFPPDFDSGELPDPDVRENVSEATESDTKTAENGVISTFIGQNAQSRTETHTNPAVAPDFEQTRKYKRRHSRND